MSDWDKHTSAYSSGPHARCPSVRKLGVTAVWFIALVHDFPKGTSLEKQAKRTLLTK
eukprot:m.342160 g.342160  ORF g.342160 m.342160 type:complete len:57 (+) comp19840_c0_seq1:612-782(+)